MSNIVLNRKDLSTIARYAYGSGFFFEGEKGGRGEMGLLTGPDGHMRVIKFNTHKGEGGVATQEMINASNRLREQLLELAHSYGVGADVIDSIRTQLGLAPDQEPGAVQSLLSRKVVATVVKMIDRDVWTHALHADDGDAPFDIAALKSRGGNMEFASVKADHLGLETNDAVTRVRQERRESLITTTVEAELAKLAGDARYKSMSPEALHAFKAAIDEGVRLWKTTDVSDVIERGLTSVRPTDERRDVQKQLVNLVRVNFVRALIIYGRANDAKSFVRENAKQADAWKSYESFVLFVSNMGLNKTPGQQGQFLMELNRFRKSKYHPYKLYGMTGTDLTNPLSDAPKVYGHRWSDAVFNNPRGMRGDKPDPSWPTDLQQRQALWEEIDRLPKGFLPESQLNSLKSDVSTGKDELKLTWIRAAFDSLKDEVDLAGLANRLATAYKEASGRDEVPKQMIDKLLSRLRTAVFASHLNGDKNILTMEAAVKWFVDNPTALLQLDRSLDLSQMEKVKKDIKDALVKSFMARPSKDFCGTDGFFMQTARDSEDGDLTLDGKDLPSVPSEGFVMPQSGVSGTDSSLRKAYVETFFTKINDRNQRKLVSFLFAMAEGLSSVVGTVAVKGKGLQTDVEICDQFAAKGLIVTDNKNHRYGDMKIDEDGTVHLKMKVGFGLGFQILAGCPLPLRTALVNECYEFDITVPKPQSEDVPCPDFTIDSIEESDVDLLR